MFGLFGFVVLVKVDREGPRLASLETRRTANDSYGTACRIFFDGAIGRFHVYVGRVENEYARVTQPSRVIRRNTFGDRVASYVSSIMRIRRPVGAG